MMDPNLFHIDWERTFEALAGIVVLSFFVERTCALLFESRWWIRKFEDAKINEDSPHAGTAATGDGAASAPPDADTAVTPVAASAQSVTLPGQKYPLKELIGFIVALLICWAWKFDAVSIVLLSDETRLIGMLVTAGVVAGGSKASIKLFHDVLRVGSSATKKRQEMRKQTAKG